MEHAQIEVEHARESVYHAGEAMYRREMYVNRTEVAADRALSVAAFIVSAVPLCVLRLTSLSMSVNGHSGTLKSLRKSSEWC